MPAQKPSDPERRCAHCGKLLKRKLRSDGRPEAAVQFARRQFCDRQCMGAATHNLSQNGTAWKRARTRSGTRLPKGPCHVCGTKNATDITDLGDGEVRICRSCNVKRARPKATCLLCDRPVHSKSYCGLHYQRFRKHGDPMTIRVNQHTPPTRLDTD